VQEIAVGQARVRHLQVDPLDAAEHGAVVRTRTRCTRAERREEWELVLNARGRRDVKTARVLVNAAGPWIGEVADTVIRQPLARPVRLIKGSHIVVRRRFDHDYGYLLQAPDRRVVFVLPFADDFTLIGTTDENFIGDLNSPVPDPDEITYLCEAINRYFRDKVTPDQLVWSFAGVRALYDDGAAKPEDVTRDYELVLDERKGEAPLLTIYGGKITTHRRLAEAAMARIGHFFEGGSWTAGSNLGGVSPEGSAVGGDGGSRFFPGKVSWCGRRRAERFRRSCHDLDRFVANPCEVAHLKAKGAER
jgi:glycerol-3-phosphate dehydrogenase